METNTTNKNYLEEFKKAPVTYILVAINFLVFIILEILGGTQDAYTMAKYGAMNPYMIVHFHEWYRLFSCMFLHFGIEHLFNNMLLLFFLGAIFEKAVGTVRFTGIYLGAGLCGSFASFMYQCLMGRDDLTAGASGAIFGVVGGMIIVLIVHKGRYEGITMKRMLMMAILTLYFGFTTVGTDNVGHVFGLVGGILLTFVTYGIPTLIKKFKEK